MARLPPNASCCAKLKLKSNDEAFTAWVDFSLRYNPIVDPSCHFRCKSQRSDAPESVIMGGKVMCFPESSAHSQYKGLQVNDLQPFVGGKTGIRTLGTRKGTTVFETVPIDHSGIFPSDAPTGWAVVSVVQSYENFWGLANFSRFFYPGQVSHRYPPGILARPGSFGPGFRWGILSIFQGRASVVGPLKMSYVVCSGGMVSVKVDGGDSLDGLCIGAW